MKKNAIILLCIFSWQIANCQVLTLDSCRAMALRNNAKLENARLEIESARQTKYAAFSKYFPTLSIAAGYFRSQNYLIDVSSESSGAKIDATLRFDGESIEDRVQAAQLQFDRLGIDIDLQSEIDNFVERFSYDITIQMIDRGFTANALLTQPVFAGGRIVNGNRLAQLGVEVAELKLMMTEREALLNAEQYYWQVVMLRLKLLPCNQALVLLDTLCRDAEAGVQAGVIARTDLLKARLKQNEMRQTLTQLINGIELATMALCQYIGLPYTETVSVEMPTDTSLNDLKIEPESLKLEPNLSRPEYSLLESAVRAEQLRRKMMVGESLPQVAIGATYGIQSLTGTYRQNGILFATVNIPLTAWWEAAHNIRKQNLAVRMAENSKRDNGELMWLQQRQAYNALCEAYEQIGLKRQAANDAVENLVDVKNFYDAGLSSVSDYLEAQTLLYQTRNQYYDQLIDYKLKELRYRQLTEEK